MSLNLYTYVHNNPLTNVDPSGHMGQPVNCIGANDYACKAKGEAIRQERIKNAENNEYALGFTEFFEAMLDGTGVSSGIKSNSFYFLKNSKGIFSSVIGKVKSWFGSTEKLVPVSVTATSDIRKFTEYIFKPGNDNGKLVLFEGLGYSYKNSLELVDLYTKQAAEKYAKGMFTLGKLDQYGQRITIDIVIPGIGDATGKTTTFKTGWMIMGDGSIDLKTPMSGFPD